MNSLMYQSAETSVANYLDPGERLLWCGQPRPGIRLRPQDIFLIPFSVLWGGFAIFWETMAVAMTFSGKMPSPFALIFPLWGLPFVAVGLYFMFGRFLVDKRIRAQTFYGVTNDRVIIISGLFWPTIKSLPLRTITDVSLTQKADGSGRITFGPTPFSSWFYVENPWLGQWPGAPSAFDLIDDVKRVHDIVRTAQKAASGNG